MSVQVKITTDDVDAVASLVEAANELDFEPFFGKDEQFSQCGSAEHKMIFKLGDRFHFRGLHLETRAVSQQRNDK